MLIQIFGHLTFTLIALSFLVRGMFWLRLLSILSSMASIGYNFYVAETPLWLVINWNLVFIAINLFQLGRMAWEQRAAGLSPEDRALYDSHFRNLTVTEFRKLLKLARHEAAEAGTCLARAGEPLAKVLLMQQGEASVLASGCELDRIVAGDFVGEGRLIGNELASASVQLSEPSLYLSWDAEELSALCEREPALGAALRFLAAQDLSRKLSRQDQRPVTGLQPQN